MGYAADGFHVAGPARLPERFGIEAILFCKRRQDLVCRIFIVLSVSGQTSEVDFLFFFSIWVIGFLFLSRNGTNDIGQFL